MTTYFKAKSVKLRPMTGGSWFAIGWGRSARLTKTGRGKFTVTIAGDSFDLELSEKDAKQWVRETLARMEFGEI
jgi:hypothetical protein